MIPGKTRETELAAEYLVHHGGGPVQGPFDLSFIEAMVMTGVYPPDVPVQEVGKTGVFPFRGWTQQTKLAPFSLGERSGELQGTADNEQGERQPKQDTLSEDLRASVERAAQRRERQPKPSKPLSSEEKIYWWIAAAVVAAIVVFLLSILNSSPPPASSSSSQRYASASSRDSSTAQAPSRSPAPRSSPSSAPLPNPSLAPFAVEIAPSPQPKCWCCSPPEYIAPIVFEIAPSPSLPSSVSTRAGGGSTRTTNAPQPDDDSRLYRDASGRVYRVPNADYFRLLTKKSALDTKQRSMDDMEDQLESLGREVDRERLYLNRYSQASVDAFNRKVGSYNSLNERLQHLVDGYNRDVDAFNAELARVGTLIR